MTQGEAVFQAVSAVVGEINGPVQLTEQQKKEVHAIVLHFFLNGDTVHKGNPTKEQLMKYVPGLVNNWCRKDLRLNGGTKYTAKNPGSRAGSGDEQLRAMKALLAATADPAAQQEIQAAIEARKLELKPAVAKLDPTKLPEHLRKFVR